MKSNYFDSVFASISVSVSFVFDSFLAESALACSIGDCCSSVFGSFTDLIVGAGFSVVGSFSFFFFDFTAYLISLDFGQIPSFTSRLLSVLEG